VIHATVIDMLIHDVRDRHAAVEVVHNERSTGAAPERNSMTLDVRSVNLTDDVAIEAIPEVPIAVGSWPRDSDLTGRSRAGTDRKPTSVRFASQ